MGVASFPIIADVNECRESDVCGKGNGIECLNRPGSYECICKDGFEGDPKRGCSGQFGYFYFCFFFFHFAFWVVEKKRRFRGL